MSAAHVNGITIEYDVHGPDDAEPLLLVMGLSGQLIDWPQALVDQLVAAGPFRVIRFDNRDIGLSTKLDAPPPTPRQLLLALLSRRFARSSYLLADMAADAVGLLDHLGIDRAHVVGMSMGGMIAQTMAIEHPQRVTSLTSIMSNTGDRKHGRSTAKVMRQGRKLLRPDPDADPIERAVETFRLVAGPHFDEAVVRERAKAGYERDPDRDGTARQMVAIAASPDRTADLAGVQVPTLVVHGLVDPLVKPDGGIATAQAVPGARLVMFPDMGHDLPAPRLGEIVAEVTATAREAARRR